MYKENRKFSIPFSYVVNPSDYLKMIKPYKKHIHSIFVGLPELSTQLSCISKVNLQNFDESSSKEFLDLSKGLYKRFVPYNIVSYKENDFEILKNFEKTVYPLIEHYQIDGFILTHFDLARMIKKDFPNIEIHTSCNSYHWNISTMEHWRNEVGVTLFNPPREAARMKGLLKSLKNDGYKLKVLLNEACIYGCVYRYTANCGNCMKYNFINGLRTNFIVPRWMDELDEYVDVYKLSGRMETLSKLKCIFDSYIFHKPFKYINDVVVCKMAHPINVLYYKYGIMIKESDLSDKLLYCENKDCYLGCDTCSSLYKKLGIDSLDLPYDVLEREDANGFYI